MDNLKAAAIKQAKDIKREIRELEAAIKKTDSPHLKRDYRKKINSLKEDLKDYCYFKNISYQEVMKS
jgi:phage host-nuclease inhibitor protein Gam